MTTNVPESDRYPFRRRPGESKEQHDERLAEAIRSVEPFLQRELRRRRIHVSELDDAAQDVRLELLTRGLPAYDAEHPAGAKPSTFLMRCTAYAALAAAKRRTRRERREATATLPHFHWVQGPDWSDDIRGELLIARVLAHLDALLLPKQARVVRTVLAHPHESRRELAERLGYSQDTTVSETLRRAWLRLVAKLEAGALD